MIGERVQGQFGLIRPNGGYEPLTPRLKARNHVVTRLSLQDCDMRNSKCAALRLVRLEELANFDRMAKLESLSRNRPGQFFLSRPDSLRSSLHGHGCHPESTLLLRRTSRRIQKSIA